MLPNYQLGMKPRIPLSPARGQVGKCDVENFSQIHREFFRRMLAVIPGRKLLVEPNNSAVISMVSLEGSTTGPTSMTLASWRSPGLAGVTTISSVPLITRPRYASGRANFTRNGE